ncbi:MAG: AAA family ATPase [Bacteroidales bacterium]|nr:AAA family ATPase [Bacteroidales bacterium]
MISRIEIKSLFGLYNYNIGFDNNLQIITGPNGYGKTTILTIIKNLFEKNFWYFYYLDFDSIIVDIVEQNILKSINIVRTRYEISDSEDNRSGLKVEFYFNDEKKFEIDDRYIHRLCRDYDYRYSPKALYERYAIKSEDEFLSFSYNPKRDEYIKKFGNEFDLLFGDKIINFIGANRIYRNNEYNHNSEELIKYTIDEISSELGKEYEKQQNIFAEESRKIDAGFIKRLINEDNPNVSDEQLEINIQELENTIQNYRKFNIVAQDFVIEKFGEYSDKYKDAISLYISDMRKKMEIFKPFYDKLEIFQSFISKKGLSDKQIEFSSDGIKIINTNGVTLENLHKLSSGEQNLLILYYNLIFKSNNRTVLLIDEPENSMHMAWLDDMLSDYKIMAKNIGCQIIIATHSPAFIKGEWNLTYDLFEQTTNQ